MPGFEIESETKIDLILYCRVLVVNRRRIHWWRIQWTLLDICYIWEKKKTRNLPSGENSVTANWQESRVLQFVRFLIISTMTLKIKATNESANSFKFAPTVENFGVPPKLSTNLVIGIIILNHYFLTNVNYTNLYKSHSGLLEKRSVNNISW